MFHFLFLLFLHRVLSQSYCGSYLPKDESTCDKYTNSTFIFVISLVIYLVLFSQCAIPFHEKTTTRCLAQFQSTTTTSN